MKPNSLGKTSVLQASKNIQGNLRFKLGLFLGWYWTEHSAAKLQIRNKKQARLPRPPYRSTWRAQGPTASSAPLMVDGTVLK